MQIPLRLAHPGFLARLEKAFVLSLAVGFTLPLALGFWLRESQNQAWWTDWLRNVTLRGVQLPAPEIAPSRANVLSARFQNAYAQHYDRNFAGRELLIRFINEVYLRALHTAHAEVAVGPGLSLVEPVYVTDYCLLRPDKDALRPLAENLRRMQTFCDARGIAFALVITPSKAAVYPEGSPTAWQRRHRPGPRYYDTFLPLLRELGIRYVDGHQIALDMKRSATVPVFPLGGVHWGQAPALATVNALLELLSREGLGVGPIRNARQAVSRDPQDQDSDMSDLLNTLIPWHNPVVKVSVPPMPPPPGYRPDMVLVGGSFVWKMLDLLDASRQFSELEFYHYYQAARYCQLEGDVHLLAEPTPPVDFGREVFAADSLVLEVNEEALHAPKHLDTFLHDALAVLPDPHAARAPFAYQGRMQYRWGDPISLVEGQNTINMAATSGFSTPGGVGSYTVGPVAEIRFAAPPPPGDMVLEVDARAWLVDTRLTEQRASVFVNGHPLGERTWNQPTLERREWTIPREFLTGGQVRLEFRLARPGSLVEFGLGVDPRKFALIIPEMRFHEAGK